MTRGGVMDMKTIARTERWAQPATPEDQQLARIEASLKRLERLFDEFAGVFLNAKFPYGKPTDRWARR
jgi:hypothetical protein